MWAQREGLDQSLHHRERRSFGGGATLCPRPALVLVHGATGDHTAFHGVLPELEPHLALE
jgi:pimeloyl-ACP methyl ester carboxylesterase